MKCQIPQISWHSRDPVLSIDFQPIQSDQFRLASGGTDSHVLIWYVTYQENKTVKVECASDLYRHNKSVNVVRFSPSGEFLASGDDEGAMFVWQLKEREDIELPKDDENINKEEWYPMKLLRGHLEDIYDISWSKDCNFLVSASMDNTAIVWDMQKFVKVHIFSDFKGYVQGVSWDPCNQFIASLGSDRTLRIHNISSKKTAYRVSKAPWSHSTEKGTFKPRLFYDDTLKSYFRRLTYTPDGELLIAPSGISEKGDKMTNTCYVFSRHVPQKPVLTLSTGDWYTIAVRCNPFMYKLRKEENASSMNLEKENAKPKTMINLPYRMIFAVAACDCVLMYDTEQLVPFACISNIHYTPLTDLAWSPDGLTLVASSTDGYCSFITFTREELGEIYVPEEVKVKTDKMIDNLPAASDSIDSPSGKEILTPKVKLSATEKSPSNVSNVSDVTKSPSSGLIDKNLEKKSPKLASIKNFFVSPKTVVKTPAASLAKPTTAEKENSSAEAVVKLKHPVIVIDGTPEKKDNSAVSANTPHEISKVSGKEVVLMDVDEAVPNVEKGNKIAGEKSAKCKIRLDFSGNESKEVAEKENNKTNPKMSIKRFFLPESKQVSKTKVNNTYNVPIIDKNSMDTEKNADIEFTCSTNEPVSKSKSQQVASSLSDVVARDGNLCADLNDNMDVDKSCDVHVANWKNSTIDKKSIATSLNSDGDLSSTNKNSVRSDKNAGSQMLLDEKVSDSETTSKTNTCLSITHEPMIFDENASGGDDTIASVSEMSDEKAVIKSENDWKLELSQDDDFPIDAIPEPKPSDVKVTPKRRIPFITLSSKTTINK